MGHLRNLLYIMPIILYYLIESMFLAVIIYPIWRFILCEKLNGLPLSYSDWVFIIWIIKILLFDIFKVTSFFLYGDNDKTTENNDDENNLN
jgi:hypothetical protein